MSQAIIRVNGDLAKPPEEKFWPDGNKYYKLTIPVSEGRDKPTTWYEGVLGKPWCDNDKFMALLKKKTGVVIEGKHQFSTYSKNDGTTGFNNTVKVAFIDITKYAPDEGAGAAEDEQPF